MHDDRDGQLYRLALTAAQIAEQNSSMFPSAIFRYQIPEKSLLLQKHLGPQKQWRSLPLPVVRSCPYFLFEKSTHFADPNTSLDTKAHLSLKLEGFRVFHSQCKPVEQAYLNAY